MTDIKLDSNDISNAGGHYLVAALRVNTVCSIYSLAFSSLLSVCYFTIDAERIVIWLQSSSNIDRQTHPAASSRKNGAISVALLLIAERHFDDFLPF